MTSDLINNNFAFKYDYRNLILEMQNTSSINNTFLYQYKYDEAGNRVKKTIYRSNIQPPPPPQQGDNPGVNSQVLYS